MARLRVDLIATQGTATRLPQKVSTTVPVVYVFNADPVLGSIADSLARPGRNMTGITLLSAELNGKRLELLRAICPDRQDRYPYQTMLQRGTGMGCNSPRLR